MMFGQSPKSHRIFKRLSKGSDQTAHMRKLNWTFAGSTYNIQGLYLVDSRVTFPMPKSIFFQFSEENFQFQARNKI